MTYSMTFETPQTCPKPNSSLDPKPALAPRFPSQPIALFSTQSPRPETWVSSECSLPFTSSFLFSHRFCPFFLLNVFHHCHLNHSPSIITISAAYCTSPSLHHTLLLFFHTRSHLGESHVYQDLDFFKLRYSQQNDFSHPELICSFCRWDSKEV